MPNTTADFFERLRTSEHEPLLRRAEGTVRFDLTNGNQTEHWLVSLRKGDISVSRRNARADCTFRADRRLFDKIVTGEMNGLAAVLRGEVNIEGDPELAVLFQRMFGRPTSPSEVAAPRA